MYVADGTLESLSVHKCCIVLYCVVLYCIVLYCIVYIHLVKDAVARNCPRGIIKKKGATIP